MTSTITGESCVAAVAADGTWQCQMDLESATDVSRLLATVTDSEGRTSRPVSLIEQADSGTGVTDTDSTVPDLAFSDEDRLGDDGNSWFGGLAVGVGATGLLTAAPGCGSSERGGAAATTRSTRSHSGEGM